MITCHRFSRYTAVGEDDFAESRWRVKVISESRGPGQIDSRRTFLNPIQIQPPAVPRFGWNIRSRHDILHRKGDFARPLPVSRVAVDGPIDLHTPLKLCTVPALVGQGFADIHEEDVEHRAERIYFKFDIARLPRIRLEKYLDDFLCP